MQQGSLWLTFDSPASYPELKQDIEVDILIIGAGITGITLAMELLASGKKVVICEAKTVARGTTGSSTANLYVPVLQKHAAIQRKFDKQALHTIIQSRLAAINYIAETVAKLNIPCNLVRRPFYMFTQQTKKIAALEKEAEILVSAGLDVEFTKELPLAISARKIMRVKEQARLNPYLYTTAIAQHLAAQGCTIYENTPIVKLSDQKDYCRVFTPKAKIKAKTVVMATHVPKGINIANMLVFPYRSYVLSMKLAGNQYPQGQFWDFDQTLSISTHNVIGENNDILLIAGNRHKVGQFKFNPPSNHYEMLESYALQNFQVSSFEHRWSAQHYLAADLVPQIGLASRFSKNIFMATGYATDGLIYGTVAGILLSHLVQEKFHYWHDVYNPNRFKPLAQAPKAIKENLNVAWLFLADNLAPVDMKKIQELKPGEGKIIKIAGKKWAAYKDGNNKLYIVSAVCTHMKCLVRWNNLETSWDCPCHGSRFKITGEVIEGPALTPLAAMPQKQN